MSSPTNFRQTGARRGGSNAAGARPPGPPAPRRPDGPATRASAILRELSATHVNQVLAFAEYLRSQEREHDESMPLLTTGFDLIAEQPAERPPSPWKRLGLAKVTGATLLIAILTTGGLWLFGGASDTASDTASASDTTSKTASDTASASDTTPKTASDTASASDTTSKTASSTAPAPAARAEVATERSSAGAPLGDAVAPAITAPPTFRAYAIQPGDSLSLIAGRLLGDTSAWPRIQQANPGLLDDPSLIEVGDVIRVPTRASDAPVDGD